jgi:DNA-directed RNA polymerase specialized sigma24 family protein
MKITQEIQDFTEAQKWDEDVKQDVYVILLEKEEGYMGNVSVEQLVTSIYNLRCLNGYRQEARRKELVEENIQAIEAFHGTDDTHDPLEYMGAEEILNKISNLSPLLYDTLSDLLDGMTPRQCAVIDKVDTNTIYQRIHAIKQELHNGR